MEWIADILEEQKILSVLQMICLKEFDEDLIFPVQDLSGVVI